MGYPEAGAFGAALANAYQVVTNPSEVAGTAQYYNAGLAVVAAATQFYQTLPKDLVSESTAGVLGLIAAPANMAVGISGLVADLNTLSNSNSKPADVAIALVNLVTDGSNFASGALAYTDPRAAVGFSVLGTTTSLISTSLSHNQSLQDQINNFFGSSFQGAVANPGSSIAAAGQPLGAEGTLGTNSQPAWVTAIQQSDPGAIFSQDLLTGTISYTPGAALACISQTTGMHRRPEFGIIHLRQ